MVEVLDAGDSILLVMDSPNGRNGPEVVELVSPQPANYTLRVRPFDGQEPEGRYMLAVTGWRDARGTRELLAGRHRARDSAAAWLRPRSAALPGVSLTALSQPLLPLDSLAARVDVLGIGEATHGSREFGDLRLVLTRYLVERHGYRIVAIEAGASRLALLDRFVQGEIAGGEAITRVIESGWIGRRTLGELVTWLREWNEVHPAEQVRLVGLDPQESELARSDLRSFLARAYPQSMDRYAAVERELAIADSQASVFGDSRVDSTARQFLREVVSQGENDESLLLGLFDSTLVRSGLTAARLLLQFADFNAGDSDAWSHSRDWYMAANLLRALQPGRKAVYWAHNAHVAAPSDRPPQGQPMGSWLRAALGCRYGALAVTFNEGGFVAQIPNDLEDDLAANTLPPSPDETIEGVLRTLHSSGTLATWTCENRARGAPAWLLTPQRMHWVGALFRPGTEPSEAFRPFRLLDDFDAIVLIPRVTADELPPDRPLIPARRRD